MYEVAFQDYQVPPSQNLGDVSENPPPDPDTLTQFMDEVETILTGTGDSIDGDELALLAPDEWESFLIELLGFVQSGPHGSDQNSGYDYREDTSPLGELLVHDFGWMHGVQNLAGYGYYNYLTENIDAEFLEMEYAAHLGTSRLLQSGVSMGSLANLPFDLTLNGHTFSIVWHNGAAPGPDGSHDPNDPELILVHASLGYWAVHLDPPGPALGGESAPHAIDLTQLNEQNVPWLPVVDQALRYLAQDPLALQVLLDAWHHGTKIRIVTGNAETQYSVSDNVVQWNPTLGLRLTNGGLMSPAMCLLHELAHATLTIFGNDFEYSTLEDRYIIEHIEQIVGMHLGEPTRENHRGTFEHAFTVVYHQPAPH